MGIPGRFVLDVDWRPKARLRRARPVVELARVTSNCFMRVRVFCSFSPRAGRRSGRGGASAAWQRGNIRDVCTRSHRSKSRRGPLTLASLDLSPRGGER